MFLIWWAGVGGVDDLQGSQSSSSCKDETDSRTSSPHPSVVPPGRDGQQSHHQGTNDGPSPTISADHVVTISTGVVLGRRHARSSPIKQSFNESSSGRGSITSPSKQIPPNQYPNRNLTSPKDEVDYCSRNTSSPNRLEARRLKYSTMASPVSRSNMYSKTNNDVYFSPAGHLYCPQLNHNLSNTHHNVPQYNRGNHSPPYAPSIAKGTRGSPPTAAPYQFLYQIPTPNKQTPTSNAPTSNFNSSTPKTMTLGRSHSRNSQTTTSPVSLPSPFSNESPSLSPVSTYSVANPNQLYTCASPPPASRSSQTSHKESSPPSRNPSDASNKQEFNTSRHFNEDLNRVSAKYWIAVFENWNF